MFSIKAYQITYCRRYKTCQNETKISIGEVTAVTPTVFCYQVPFDRYPFQNSKQVIIVTANTNLLPKRQFSDHDRSMIIYLSGKNGTTWHYEYGSNYLPSSYFDSEMEYTITVSAVYQSMPSLGRCNEYKTYENCLSECRVALFRQMCNCTPITWSSWTSSELYRECKLSIYTSCAKYNGDYDSQCVKEHCASLGELCERRVLRLQLISEKYTSTGARTVLHIGSFDYPIFEERYELSVEEFIGALGGALGFYLGVDVLGILLIFGRIIALLGLFDRFKIFKSFIPTEVNVET